MRSWTERDLLSVHQISVRTFLFFFMILSSFKNCNETWAILLNWARSIIEFCSLLYFHLSDTLSNSFSLYLLIILFHWLASAILSLFLTFFHVIHNFFPALFIIFSFSYSSLSSFLLLFFLFPFLFSFSYSSTLSPKILWDLTHWCWTHSTLSKLLQI